MKGVYTQLRLNGEPSERLLSELSATIEANQTASQVEFVPL